MSSSVETVIKGKPIQLLTRRKTCIPRTSNLTVFVLSTQICLFCSPLYLTVKFTLFFILTIDVHRFIFEVKQGSRLQSILKITLYFHEAKGNYNTFFI